MERKLIVLKTFCDTQVGADFTENITTQISSIVKQCSQGSPDPTHPLATAGLSYCVLPQSSWTKVEGEQSLSTAVKTADSCSSSEESLSCLSTSLHTALDQLADPGTYLLSLLWLCDSLPTAFPPALYGSLQRAVSWHSASISVITSTATCTEVPSWLAPLRAEVLPLSYLCSCHGLQEFLPPDLIWRGSLAFYQEPNLTPLTLPGFELHLDKDLLTSTLAALDLQGEGVVSASTFPRYFSPHLELVSSVSLSSVISCPHLLTSERFLLKTPILEQDDCSNQFMTSAFQSPDMAMVLKLKFSVDKPKTDLSLMKTDHWKSSVINCNFSPTPPCPSMGVDVSSINILIYDDPDTEGDCSRSTHQKAAVMLKNIQELGQMSCLRQVLSKQEIQMEAVREVVEGKIFHVDDTKHIQLKQFIRRVQTKVLENLHEHNSEFLKNNDIEDILIAVQDKLMQHVGISMYTTVSEQNIDDLEENIELKKEAAVKNIADADDWQEKRFLRFLKLHSEQEEKNLQSKSILKPSEEDYVLLEAKELLKFFDKNGLPTKPLEPAEAKNKCPLRPQKTELDYRQMMKDNYENIPATAHSYKGFKFKGEDFSKVEFTQFHDVYYNTGVSAEAYDLECKNLRDCMVGPSRETECTFSVGRDTTRIKLGTKKSEDPVGQTLPLKKLQPTRSSPRKKATLSVPIKKPVSHKLSPRTRKLGYKQQPAQKAGKDLAAAAGDTKKIATKADNSEKRKSGGETGELSDLNRKKLRSAVYQALLTKDIEEKHDLFRPCFAKLFNVCKMYVVDAQMDASESTQLTKKWMLEIAELNAKLVVDMEKMKNRKK
eukprot:GFUD01028818.1.p1 GENE.GFUD01028818.1~~GFUD01028818.1.p1  ORF type:complete len:828 (+),score=221.61 GFUD01028818.1:45-2528(+)